MRTFSHPVRLCIKYGAGSESEETWKLLWSEKGVSPVIGTILMVAVTVVMAAIIGGFVYQMARPQEVPNLVTSLQDDERVVLVNNSSNGRVARLVFESGNNIAKSELTVFVTYTGGDASGTEYTASLDGRYWDTLGAPLYAGEYGNLVYQGIYFKWVDSDGSEDFSSADRLDFYEDSTVGGIMEVAPNTDFTVKVTHKSSKATISNHTIKVY